MTASEAKKQLRKFADPKKAEFLKRFFKTGPGEYAAGDVLIGVTVPNTRKVAKQFKDLSLGATTSLLKSKIHEERLLALLLLVQKYKKGTESDQKKIYALYLRNTKHINNWDLVDASAEHIVGRHLIERARSPLHRLSPSKDLWERRISVMSTFHFIKQGHPQETLRIATKLLHDKEDLIHKAVGWMLREVGNRNRPLEETFLKKHYKKMPRTMLRYAIERFPERRRKAYLKGKI